MTDISYMICRVVSAAYPIEIFQKRGFLKNKTHKILWSAVIWRLCISKTKGSQIPFVFLKLDDFWGVVEWVSYFWGPYRHLKSVPNNHQRTTVYKWHPRWTCDVGVTVVVVCLGSHVFSPQRWFLDIWAVDFYFQVALVVFYLMGSWEMRTLDGSISAKRGGISKNRSRLGFI